MSEQTMIDSNGVILAKKKINYKTYCHDLLESLICSQMTTCCSTEEIMPASGQWREIRVNFLKL